MKHLLHPPPPNNQPPNQPINGSPSLNRCLPALVSTQLACTRKSSLYSVCFLPKKTFFCTNLPSKLNTFFRNNIPLPPSPSSSSSPKQQTTIVHATTQINTPPAHGSVKMQKMTWRVGLFCFESFCSMCAFFGIQKLEYLYPRYTYLNCVVLA